MTGNKGEWSEFYVFLRLLADGKIYGTDADLKKIDDICFKIFKIMREEYKGNKYEYNINDGKIDIYLNNKKLKYVEIDQFKKQADYLFEKILEGKGAFEIIKTELFMKEIFCQKIKAPSSDKSDIIMQLFDIYNGHRPICGFSIKSELGGDSTLLNASSATNFIFQVEGLDKSDVNKINAINTKSKIQDRCLEIIRKKGTFKFFGVKNQIFNTNLLLIDTRMPEILSCLLIQKFINGKKNISDIVETLEASNPVNFPGTQFYKYKIKKFLIACALGLKPATQWSGIDEASGGYIIVTKSGEVLSFFIYNRNYFEDYLFNSTYLETSSASKHSFGQLYEKDGNLFFELNLQIRFLCHNKLDTKNTDADLNYSVASNDTEYFKLP